MASKITITNKGFTLLEVLIVIILLSGLIAITMTGLDMSSSAAQNCSSSIIASMGEIEGSFGNYITDKNQTETNTTLTGLTDTSFIPYYLMIPNTIQNFDSTYNTNIGYLLANQTGQLAGNNGWYIATRVNIANSTDTNWKGIILAANKLSPNKFFYNTSAAAVTDMAPPAVATTVYITYWITRR